MKKIALVALSLTFSASAFAAGNIEAGKVAAAKFNCASCHGANFSKPITETYPKIAGQYPDYLFVALKAYKADGKSPVLGRNNAIMGGIAKQFTNNELKLLAKYMGSLSTDLEVTPESRFR